jgi:hypothetical protein
MAVSANVTTGKRAYPLFKQCDPLWGNVTMGTDGPGERASICREGCAMSCLSMALAAVGVSIDGQAATPLTNNAWLMANAGYMCAGGDCNNLVLNAVERLTPLFKLVSEAPKQDIPTIQKGLTSGDYVYIAHVHDKHHFVLLTGFNPASPDVFYVNDPFYNSTWYPYANISDIILYQVLQRELELPKTAIVPRYYPLFKQCNSSWGNNVMEKQTICQVGCLMSSTSMAINSWHINIAGQDSDPAVLNKWLRNNKGYVDGDDLDEDVVPNINRSSIVWPSDGMHAKNDLSIATIRGYLVAGRVVIANVMKGGHFVLTVGWDATNPDTFYINDPGFQRTSYSYSQDIVGWRIFDMR